MENKHVGYILLGVSVLIVIIVFMFQNALTSFVNSSCTLAHGGDSCPMYDTINQQTYLALGIVGILILVSLVMISSKPQERVIIKTRTVEKKIQKKFLDTSTLKPEEKQVLKIIQENKTIFQGDLIEKTQLGKAKITRIIDRLEGKGFVERKRRGMTNIVVLKE
ncbi:MarR family transcriptional regulator [Candidatus Pacearchaeota archaeon]|nr:MarR family transcriptional regulator [Candidatus Pacearchaeota archaeon]